MKRLSALTMIALTVVVTASCGSAGSRAPSPFDGSASGGGGSGADDPIRVDIQNLSFNDITVFAVRQSGQRIRIARVTGKTDETVTVRWNVAVPISFLIEQTAGVSCRTGQVGVEPNARVWVSVPSNVGVQGCRAGRR